MLALLAALLLSTARAATPEAGVQEDASIAIETPAKVVRHFDGSLRIGYADPLDLGQGSSFMESLAARLEESLRGAGKGGADVSVTLHKYAPFDLQTAVVSHEVDLFLVTSGYYIYLSDMGAGVEWISTLKPPQATDPERAAGSVFVVRADHPLQPGLRSEDRLRGGRGHGVLRRLDHGARRSGQRFAVSEELLRQDDLPRGLGPVRCSGRTRA